MSVHAACSAALTRNRAAFASASTSAAGSKQASMLVNPPAHGWPPLAPRLRIPMTAQQHTSLRPRSVQPTWQRRASARRRAGGTGATAAMQAAFEAARRQRDRGVAAVDRGLGTSAATTTTRQGGRGNREDAVIRRVSARARRICAAGLSHTSSLFVGCLRRRLVIRRRTGRPWLMRQGSWVLTQAGRVQQ